MSAPDSGSNVSATAYDVLANRDVYVDDDQLQRVRHAEKEAATAASNTDRARRERHRRVQEHESRIRSAVTSAVESQSTGSRGPSGWRERLRQSGLDKISTTTPTVVTVSDTTVSRSTAPVAKPLRAATAGSDLTLTSDSDGGAPGPLPTTGPVNDQALINRAVDAAVKRVQNPRHMSRVRRYVTEELKHRISGLASDSDEVSVGSGDDNDMQAMKYWRKMLSLEEKEIETGFTTVVVLVADVVESILSDVLDFHAFETKDLSTKVHEAVDGGRFRSAIRHFCNSPSAEFMKNPYLNAVATFASIALSNHMDKAKGLVTSLSRKKPAVGIRRKKAVDKVKRRNQSRRSRKSAESCGRRSNRRRERSPRAQRHRRHRRRRSPSPPSNSYTGSSRSSSSDESRSSHSGGNGNKGRGRHQRRSRDGGLSPSPPSSRDSVGPPVRAIDEASPQSHSVTFRLPSNCHQVDTGRPAESGPVSVPPRSPPRGDARPPSPNLTKGVSPPPLAPVRGGSPAGSATSGPTQREVDAMLGDLGRFIGRAEESTQMVTDPVTGAQRPMMSGVNVGSMGNILKHSGKLAPKITHMNDSIARQNKIAREREDLGPPPSISME